MLVTTKQIIKRLPINFRLTSILEEAIINSIQVSGDSFRDMFRENK